MKQVSMGKVCEWKERGLHDAPGAAGCRFSGHLRASACIWHLWEMVVCKSYTSMMASYTAHDA